MIKKVTIAYEKYDFHEVFHSIHHFCVVDMSSIYFDILKDRLYTAKADSNGRRASQWVLSEILLALTGLMAPVLSFTSEEVWGYILSQKSEDFGELSRAVRTQKSERKIQETEDRIQNTDESVFFSTFPEAREEFIDEELEERWRNLLRVRDEVNKALEIKRAEKFIGNSLEAKVILSPPADYRDLLDQYKDFLQTFFIVSQADIAEKSLDGSYNSTEIDGLAVKVEKASGSKCLRCWNRKESVGRFEDSPDICERCYNVVK
jgi:isoleucyl-tRNA synthetase